MTPRPRDLLLHPAALAALALLVVNDQLGKVAWPGAVTGKLSDFAGLAVFPLLLAALGDGAAATLRRPRPRGLVLAATLATAIGFTLVKTWAPATGAFAAALGALQWPVEAARALLAGAPVPSRAAVGAVTDPTDLIALPAAALGVILGRRAALPHRGAEPLACAPAGHPT